MEYLLFAAYLVLFAWLVTKVKFFTRASLSKPQIIIVLLLKVMAGIFYGWIGIYYGGLAQMSDTWMYHSNSIGEYHLLLHNPHEYFTNLFRDPYGDGITKFFDTNNSYWNDLKGNVFIKILSVFNVFSLGNYYVNVIFYSFITLFGVVAIYRVMADIFPGKKQLVLLSSVFIPSFLFWASGLHKEGLIFNGLSFMVYTIYFGTKEKYINFKRVAGFIIGFLLVLTLRNFIIVILLPALLTWLLAIRWPNRSLSVFTILYLFFVILFFTARYISPTFDFPQAVVTKQQEFLQLTGNSTIPIRQLAPNAISFLKNTPQAITLTVMRPYPSDVHHILSLAAAIEVYTMLLLFLLFIFFRTNGARSTSTLYFFLFFSFSLLMAIGFSNNNLGAIVRYRSVILPFLVIPMFTQIDWKRLNKVWAKYILNKTNI